MNWGGGLPQVLIGLKLASELIETEAISGANSIRVAQTGAGTQAASVGVALHLQPAIRTTSVLLRTRASTNDTKHAESCPVGGRCEWGGGLKSILISIPGDEVFSFPSL